MDFVYTACNAATPQDCDQATLHVLVTAPAANTNPDFNVTTVNVPVTGSVKTNDTVPAGTTYGTPVASGSNPAGGSITMNPDGTYTFTGTTPGVYTYQVPVCAQGQSTGCPTETLQITVNNPNATNNAPIANPDYATTNVGTPVTVNSLANDRSGNAGTTLNPGSVTVVGQPANGTTTVDPATGAITYTPNAGFVGEDVLTYRVCDNGNPAQCATTTQTITVQPAGATNTTVAVDDYNQTRAGVAVSGNVRTNDSDPQGNTQTVTAQTANVAGKGTLQLNADGTYTFTPAAGFTGPVDFVYTTCDNGTPQACASATLHILVTAPTGDTNPDFNVTTVNVPVTGSVRTNDEVPAGTTYGTPVASGSNPAGGSITMNPDGTYTFTGTTPGVYTYEVPVCAPGQSTGCPTETLTVTVTNPSDVNAAPVANPDFNTTNQGTPVTTNVLANDRPGTPTDQLNPGSVTVVGQPANGTTTVDPATGAITYTPNAGFVGEDVLTYRVCDNSNPAQCSTTTVTYTVNPTGTPAEVVAVDDYATTSGTTPVSGNVLTNDNPGGSTLTVSNPGTYTVDGKGTLVLNANGTYTFTPVNGFTGPVDFVYTACNAATPQDCDQATLHILVQDVLVPDLTPTITLGDGQFLEPNDIKNFVVNIVNLVRVATTSPIRIRVAVSPGYELQAFDPNLTTTQVPGEDGAITVRNQDWVLTASSPTTYDLQTKPGVSLTGGSLATSLSQIGLAIKRTTATDNSTGNITVTILRDNTMTYDSNTANNLYVRIISAN